MVADFWHLKIGDIISMVILCVTVVAIIYGPIKAVEVARQREEVRDANRRKREIYTALMKTRRTYMNPDHVWALNLIQVEFQNHDAVIQAYRSYIANLSQTVPDAGAALDSFIQQRSDLFFDLLYEVAKVVGANFDKRDLERLAYVPIGWHDEENEIRLFRRSILELLHGRRPLPVAPFQAPLPTTPARPSPFPPPPPGP